MSAEKVLTLFEEPLVVEVARAGELPVAGEASREPGHRRADLAELVRQERVLRPPAPSPPRVARGRAAGAPARGGAPRRPPGGDEVRDPAGEVLGGVRHGNAHVTRPPPSCRPTRRNGAPPGPALDCGSEGGVAWPASR